jgi:hypothetical protein
MMFDRRGDYNRIEPHTVEQVFEVGQTLDVRIQAPHVLQPYFADVAHRFQIAIRQPFEVPNEIGTPIPASNHTHDNWLFHITVLNTSKTLRKSLGSFLTEAQCTRSMRLLFMYRLPPAARGGFFPEHPHNSQLSSSQSQMRATTTNRVMQGIDLDLKRFSNIIQAISPASERALSDY